MLLELGELDDENTVWNSKEENLRCVDPSEL